MQGDVAKDFAAPLARCAASATARGAPPTQAPALFAQLHSLSAVTDLWQQSDSKFDAVLYLRPDVLFLCPLDVNVLRGLDEHTVLLPHVRPDAAASDGVAIGTPDAVAVWGERCVPLPLSTVRASAFVNGTCLCLCPRYVPLPLSTAGHERYVPLRACSSARSLLSCWAWAVDVTRRSHSSARVQALLGARVVSGGVDGFERECRGADARLRTPRVVP